MSTIDHTRGPARTELDVATPADVAQLDALERAQLLIRDPRRTRPLYRDGRFLTAQDLTREQHYALARQADLASARRGGVVRGLEVTRSGDTLRVAPGTGFTPAGELVALPSPLIASIRELPEDDRIELAMGVVDVAEPVPAARGGLYVIGLRPLEHAAGPTPRYPLSIHGKAGVEDGDLVESVALALHPLRFSGSTDPDVLRGELARAMFFEQGAVTAPGVLPIALVLLERGSIRWLDPALARRELGAGPRAGREAHQQQYDRHLTELVAALRPRNALRFSASRYFRCLPPVGRLPAAAIDGAAFTQAFFPPAMTIELSAVVDEELPALIADAIHLPAIDLTGTDDDFDHTRIHILVPMSAERLAALRLAAVRPTKVVTAPPQALTRRRPLLALHDLIARRRPAELIAIDDGPEPAPVLAAWRQAIAAVPDQLLWYVRIPALGHASVELFDVPVETDGPPPPNTLLLIAPKTATDAKGYVAEQVSDAAIDLRYMPPPLEPPQPITVRPVAGVPIRAFIRAGERPDLDRGAVRKPRES